MADIEVSTLQASSAVVILAAAENDNEAVRLGEMNAALAPLLSASHAAVTVADSATIDFTLTGQQVTGSLRKKSGGHIASDSNGAYVDVTTLAAALQVAIPAASGSAAGLMSTTLWSKLDSLSALAFGTGVGQMAEGNHGHSVATTGAAGFMSAAMVTDLASVVAAVDAGLLDAAAALAAVAAAMSPTNSINPTYVGGALKWDAIVRPSYGLAIGALGLEAVFGTTLGTVAAGNHTHAGYESDIAALQGLSHAAATVLSTDTITFGLAGQQVTGSVRLKSGGGLLSDTGGIYAEFGTSAGKVAEGNHTHGDYETDIAALQSASHAAATVLSTDTITFGLSGQQVTGSVKIKPGGGLTSDTNGVFANFGTSSGTVAEGNHTHATITAAIDALEAAHDARLDALEAIDHNPATVLSSTSITMGLAGQQVTALLKMKANGGLTVDPATEGGVFVNLMAYAQTWSADQTFAARVLGTSGDGLRLGADAASKIGFFGATAVAQPSDTDQAAVSNSVSGSDGSGLSFSAGYVQSELNAAKAVIANLETQTRANTQLNNALRSALVDLGLIKGAA